MSLQLGDKIFTSRLFNGRGTFGQRFGIDHRCPKTCKTYAGRRYSEAGTTSASTPVAQYFRRKNGKRSGLCSSIVARGISNQLVKEGFIVLPYIHADPVLCKRLEDVGVAAVMPLGAAIGSNQGLQTKAFLRMIIEQSSVPVIVDAGIGAPSHAAEAMEMGADAVLVNTAIAVSGDPVGMARAFKMAVEAGRLAYESTLATPQTAAIASSPLTGFLNEI